MDNKKLSAIKNKLFAVRDLYLPTFRTISKFLTPETGIFNDLSKYENEKQLTIAQYRYILDTTPIWALKTTVSGLFNALTPPNRKWFSLEADSDDDFIFAKDIEDFIYKHITEWGFYVVLPQILRELISYGNSCMRVQYYEEKLKFKIFTVGTYAIGANQFNEIDKVCVKYELSAAEFKQEFGFLPQNQLLAKPQDIISYYGLCLKNYEKAVDDKGVKREWIEYYFNDQQILKTQGYDDNPFLVARFDLTSGANGWGVGNGIRTIGTLISLQSLLLKFCDALSEQFDPATIVNEQMFRNGAISFAPGEQNYINVLGGDMSNAVQNARKIEYNYEAFMFAMNEFRTMTKQMLDADIFLAVSGAGKQMTATEAAELASERLLRFGTLFQNITTEVVTPMMKEYVNYYYYINGIPRKKQIQVKYFGMLAQAQKQETLTKLQEAFMFAANAGVLNWLKQDKILKDVLKLLGLSLSYLKTPDEMAQEAQSMQEAQFETMQMQAQIDNGQAVN